MSPTLDGLHKRSCIKHAVRFAIAPSRRSALVQSVPKPHAKHLSLVERKVCVRLRSTRSCFIVPEGGEMSRQRSQVRSLHMRDAFQMHGHPSRWIRRPRQRKYTERSESADGSRCLTCSRTNAIPQGYCRLQYCIQTVAFYTVREMERSSANLTRKDYVDTVLKVRQARQARQRLAYDEGSRCPIS